MRILSVILLLSPFLLSLGAELPQTGAVRLMISSEAKLSGDANVVIKFADLKRAALELSPANAVVMAYESDRPVGPLTEIPSQIDDLDGDGAPDELAFQIPLRSKQRRMVSIVSGKRAVYPNRAYAKFTEKYEGMGWESERTAWRLYFDPRNAIDLFGKRVPTLSLDHFGSPGVNYHAESPKGRDIYKIGAALGIGAVGAWVDGKPVKVAEVKQRHQRVIAAGPVRAVVSLQYQDWNLNGRSVNLTSRMIQWTGERGFEHEVNLEPQDGIVLVTGLPRQPGLVELRMPPSRAGEPYSLGTWGHQVLAPGASASASLPDQNLGLAVLVPGAAADHAVADDPANYLIRVPLRNGAGRWYVTAAWDQEESAGSGPPIRTQENFTEFLKQERSRLAQTVEIRWIMK
jgi:hypothetical protein